MGKKQREQQRVEELASKIRIIDPFKDTGHDWSSKRPSVKAPDWTLEPKEPRND